MANPKKCILSKELQNPLLVLSNIPWTNFMKRDKHCSGPKLQKIHSKNQKWQWQKHQSWPTLYLESHSFLDCDWCRYSNAYYFSKKLWVSRRSNIVWLCKNYYPLLRRLNTAFHNPCWPFSTSLALQLMRLLDSETIRVHLQYQASCTSQTQQSLWQLPEIHVCAASCIT